MKNFWAKTTPTKCELYLYDEIGADFFGEGITAGSVKDALDGFKPGAALDIYINSPGGSVFDGVAIFNQLSRWSGKKTVHIDGIAASIASVIAMAGDEILMADNSLMMIHSAWGMSVGNATEMRKYAEALDKVDGTILQTYVAKTKGDQKQIADWMTAETWMDAKESVDRGFATATTAEKAMKASFPLLDKFKNTPRDVRKSANASATLLARMNVRADIQTRRLAGKPA